MRRTTVLLAACLLAGAAVGCSSEKSQDEIAAECVKAITDASTETSRPDECEGLPQDDYEALLMSWVLKDQGVIDENGDVDMGELLEDTTAAP
jgi:hypothetical protein